MRQARQALGDGKWGPCFPLPYPPRQPELCPSPSSFSSLPPLSSCLSLCPASFPNPKASLGSQNVCKMVISFPSGSLKMRICIEYPYDHSVYSKMGRGYKAPCKSGRKGRTVTMGGGRTPIRKRPSAHHWGLRPQNQPPSGPFLAFLMANSPVFVILTIASQVGTAIIPILQVDKLRGKEEEWLSKDTQQVCGTPGGQHSLPWARLPQPT